eukprot:COSAG02_NODE_33_length_50286_cov_83.550760_4_plen_196_part_00
MSVTDRPALNERSCFLTGTFYGCAAMGLMAFTSTRSSTNARRTVWSVRRSRNICELPKQPLLRRTTLCLKHQDSKLTCDTCAWTAQLVRTILLDKSWRRLLPILGEPRCASWSLSARVLTHYLLPVARHRLQLKQPSVRANEKTVYMRQPASVEKSTRPNLEKPASEFFGEGSTLAVTDPTLPYPPYLLLQISVD